MRRARSPSSWAKSDTFWTGSSLSRRAASSTDSSPAFTFSRNSLSARTSIAVVYRINPSSDQPRSALSARSFGFKKKEPRCAPCAPWLILSRAEHRQEAGEGDVDRGADDCAGPADGAQWPVGHHEERRLAIAATLS